jgi:tetratricopeptide (TPR) repeat protein
MLENFDFGTPGIGNQLTGDLEALKGYNGLRVPPEYLAEAMGRLRDKYLNIPLEAVLHPASLSAKRAAKEQQVVAASAPAVQERELTAGEWFERGFNTTDHDEELRCFGEAIRLKPDYADAFYNRAGAHKLRGDKEEAASDYQKYLDLGGGIRDGDQAEVEQTIRDLKETKIEEPTAQPPPVA